MAPTVCKLTQTGQEKTKVRKPVVEKMRRDRINRCIEQLKVLLKAKIKASQPCAKLEKADVLEMAVFYLKSNTCPSVRAQSYTHGFSRCTEETGRFMVQQNTKPVLKGQCDTTQRARVSVEDSCQITSKSSGEDALWRPW
ncbi:transcription factor HES-5-like [Carassius gibelio]|uniref:transcription factor HES-5-like n=1 Tax=Carassius gibelio TaxID=101364 RepID=UPI0022782778|nr:transcription factor HES-5-like [Carassius gibelio]